MAAAARLLGVGRSALANMLRGRARLSPDMAVRLELVFGLGMETLMEMQIAFETARARGGARRLGLRRFKG